MNSSPLISIIIPVFNAEKYLADSIESALKQSYENIEIIIVDDGSTDKSWYIIESYRKEFPKIIKTFKQKNKGASAARNKAFELSTGHYIQYLDADDLLADNKLEEQLKIFERKGNDIITSCTWIKFKEEPNYEIIKRQKIDKDYKNPMEWLVDSWNGQGSGHGSIWLTPRKTIETTGNWDETLGKNDDGDFFCRVLLNVKEIIYCASTILYYRDTMDSLSKSFSYSECEGLLRSYENYVGYLSGGLNFPKIKTALACNFSSFYSYVYPNYADLLSRAEKNIYQLGLDRFPAVGGRKFKFISKFIGLKRATQIRRLF